MGKPAEKKATYEGIYSVPQKRKMPLYAGHGVGHIWLIDPAAMTLYVFRLGSHDSWSLAASFAEDDKVRAEPFQEIEFNLEDLWL